jgi:hypothetical protein
MGVDHTPFQRVHRGRRDRLIALIAIAVVVVGGVTWFIVQSNQPRQARLPDTVLGFRPVCDDGHGTVFPKASRYTGAGPHQILAFVYETSSIGTLPVIYVSESDALPWAGDGIEQIQLVACALRVSSEASAVTTCDYRQRARTVLQEPTGPVDTLSMYKATYQVTIREVRTRRVVAKARLAGEDTTCPYSVGVFGSDARIYTWPTVAQWHQAFDRYIAGPAR